nr:uncharacterized protein LOC103222316 isoform X2 [Chlorocebus sabaeus]
MGTTGWMRSPAGGWRGWRRRAGNRGGSRDPQVIDGAGGRGCPFTTEAWTDAAGGHLRAADVRVPLAFGQALHLPHVPPAACRRPRPARTGPDRSRGRRRGRPLPAPHFRPPRVPSASIRRAVERRVLDGRRPRGRLGGGEPAGAEAGGQHGPWAVDAGVSWVPRDPAVGMDTRRSSPRWPCTGSEDRSGTGGCTRSRERVGSQGCTGSGGCTETGRSIRQEEALECASPGGHTGSSRQRLQLSSSSG